MERSLKEAEMMRKGTDSQLWSSGEALAHWQVSWLPSHTSLRQPSVCSSVAVGLFCVQGAYSTNNRLGGKSVSSGFEVNSPSISEER